MAPDVSVIIPTYRRPIPLGESIRSALDQEGVGVEVHVIDDSPEGAGRPVVEAIDDSRIRYEQMPSPTGGLPSRVRNSAWPKARGTFIPVSYTHLRAHETPEQLVCRLLLE